MSSEHIETRQKLKNICKVSTFEALIENCILSDVEKEILRLHYLKGKDFRYIGDTLGFAEVTIKKKHKKILQKLSKLI